MKNADSTYITIGKIGSSFGVHGWLKISTYTEYGPDILDYRPWYTSRNGRDWKEIDVEDGKQHGNGVIAKLAGIDTPEDARLLTGTLIAIQRSQLPELTKGEFYWSDLIGLTVINKDGTELGKVIYLMETGSNDVLVIKGNKEHAIPYLPGSVVLDINLEKKEIRVDWELL